ncbi:hypothetical protein ZHAS_00011743 [Anopheles sinensis]|uniref:Uncharacterized protein n=1 Tax=Anopheles sinensis TaxID=74873 RepID=A0A084W125_ANOSI|nr:hypothetical protein ZHAS_00011743 [Anopheles sinensis]
MVMHAGSIVKRLSEVRVDRVDRIGVGMRLSNVCRGRKEVADELNRTRPGRTRAAVVYMRHNRPATFAFLFDIRRFAGSFEGLADLEVW